MVDPVEFIKAKAKAKGLTFSQLCEGIGISAYGLKKSIANRSMRADVAVLLSQAISMPLPTMLVEFGIVENTNNFLVNGPEGETYQRAKPDLTNSPDALEFIRRLYEQRAELEKLLKKSSGQ